MKHPSPCYYGAILSTWKYFPSLGSGSENSVQHIAIQQMSWKPDCIKKLDIVIVASPIGFGLQKTSILVFLLPQVTEFESPKL